jgi:hypothetical protein
MSSASWPKTSADMSIAVEEPPKIMYYHNGTIFSWNHLSKYDLPD